MKPLIAYRLSPIAKESFLCLLSGTLLIFSFPNFNLWLLAWFAFVPLFFAIENKSKGKTFLLAYLTGIIFWTGVIYWLVHVTLPGTILLILYLALYFGLFGLIIKNYHLPFTNYQLLLIPSIWIILEYIRAHLFTGFPWALLGYSQYLNLPVIQIADIVGAGGVSFLVMMVNVVMYSLIVNHLSLIGGIRRYLAPILCLAVALAYGYCKIYLTPYLLAFSPIKISVIQGNIPQELKWDPQAKDFIISRYFNLTEQAAGENPDLIIWPEAANPEVWGEKDSIFPEICALAQKIRIPLLMGTVAKQDESYFNSALLIGSNGVITGRYDKLHLVPFGEYIPLKKILPFLEAVVPIGDMTAGKEHTIFKIQNNFAVLICFEDLFPELSRTFAKKGAHLLVNITNDAWYKRTSAAHQHLQASVFRAVENRLFLARCANTGVSGFISPSGKIISLVEDKTGNQIFITGYKTQEILIPEKTFSFYTRYGDIFLIFCFLFVLSAAALRSRQDKA